MSPAQNPQMAVTSKGISMGICISALVFLTFFDVSITIKYFYIICKMLFLHMDWGVFRKLTIMAKGNKRICLHMAVGRRRIRAEKAEEALIKPSDLVSTYCHESSMGKTASMIQLTPTRSLPGHMGIMGTAIQDEIWVGIQLNHITFQLELCKVQVKDKCKQQTVSTLLSFIWHFNMSVIWGRLPEKIVMNYYEKYKPRMNELEAFNM
ncbi:Methyltransferase-like protein 25, partial [Plecturocebus cupreus]